MEQDRSKIAPGLGARNVAALAAMRRLSQGAAHSLNNAFTAAIGEASFLLEERKDDAELVECCQLILAALERSTRITRGLLAHHSMPSDEETDLGRLLGDLAGFLQETLGSSHPLALTLPADWVGVKAEPADLELALTTLLQYAADASGAQARLDASLEKTDGCARLTVRITAPALANGAVEAVNDPTLAGEPIVQTCLAAARDVVVSVGGTLHAERTAPDTWAFVLVLPAI